jgi:hypothetical protein
MLPRGAGRRRYFFRLSKYTQFAKSSNEGIELWMETRDRQPGAAAPGASVELDRAVGHSTRSRYQSRMSRLASLPSTRERIEPAAPGRGHPRWSLRVIPQPLRVFRREGRQRALYADLGGSLAGRDARAIHTEGLSVGVIPFDKTTRVKTEWWVYIALFLCLAARPPVAQKGERCGRVFVGSSDLHSQ